MSQIRIRMRIRRVMRRRVMSMGRRRKRKKRRWRSSFSRGGRRLHNLMKDRGCWCKLCKIWNRVKMTK